ncbi:MAG: acetyl-CoA carboxyltransferase subunit alpha [Candidatus Westeberhardia cardiocondylae]|nr:acetyl-CoA carboxyltransferase subunit alpha [Candidatus Westeberhardia cardiocondylae]
MNSYYLDFEKPLEKIEKKIQYLLTINSKQKIYHNNLNKKIQKLKKKYKKTTYKIFSQLNSWQIVQLARHPMRPYTLDYISNIFTNFDELSGDRICYDDKAIIGGIALLNTQPVIIIGHQKGRNIKEKIQRNFGMPVPEGHRKALRLMQLADQFNIPLLTFIDTPGAYPGIAAENKGQAAAIAKNLQEMPNLKIPIICTIIGEGGSGGALAIGVGDKINMLEYSIYSVISPEGFASILWNDIKKSPIAAKEMKITAKKLKKLNLIDTIILEPLGGAHRNIKEISSSIKKQLLSDLKKLNFLNKRELLKRRYNRLMHYGNL